MLDNNSGSGIDEDDAALGKGSSCEGLVVPGGEPVVLEGELQLFEKVRPAEIETTKVRLDESMKIKFDREITAVVAKESLKSSDEMLSALGMCLCDAARMYPHLVKEIREEFVRCVTDRVVALEHRFPRILDGDDFASRRDFAHRAVGVAFDMLAKELDSTARIEGIIDDSRRWTGEAGGSKVDGE